MNLLRGDGPALRIGHRGAAALAPANTMQAVEAALAQGVDLVELDVFGRPDRTLVLGHSRKELGEEPVTLEDVFAFLAETAPGVGLLADLKGAGWEQELVDAQGVEAPEHSVVVHRPREHGDAQLVAALDHPA